MIIIPWNVIYECTKYTNKLILINFYDIRGLLLFFIFVMLESVTWTNDRKLIEH